MRCMNEESAEMIARFASLPMEVQRRLLRSVDVDATLSKSAGLYKTGTNTLITGWHDLIQSGTITMNGTFVSKCSNQIPCGDLLLSNGVSVIAPHAFEDCTSLTGLILPPSVTDIRNSAFDGCTRLGSITMYNSITHIGSRAFYNCSKLTSIILPPSVQRIGTEAFAKCTGMAYAILGPGVTTIGAGAFAECTELARMYIPTNVEEIGSMPFRDCPEMLLYCGVPEDMKRWSADWTHYAPDKALQVVYGLTRAEYESTIRHPAGNPANGGK